MDCKEWEKGQKREGKKKKRTMTPSAQAPGAG